MSIQRIGKCFSQVDEILSCYDKDNKVSIPSVHHSIPPSISDRDHIIKQLLGSQVFSIKPEQQHIHFPNFSSNVMKKVTKKMTDWMETHNYHKISRCSGNAKLTMHCTNQIHLQQNLY